MENVFQLRASDVVLDKVYNPLKNDDYGRLTPDQLNEWCGIIPDFFASAVMAHEPDITKADKNEKTDIVSGDMDGFDLRLIALNKVALAMDDEYGYGGFGSSVMKIKWYAPTPKPNIIGRIIGNDGEEDLDPLGEFRYKFLQLFVYEYGMVALRISGKPDTVKFARFD